MENPSFPSIPESRGARAFFGRRSPLIELPTGLEGTRSKSDSRPLGWAISIHRTSARGRFRGGSLWSSESSFDPTSPSRGPVSPWLGFPDSSPSDSEPRLGSILSSDPPTPPGGILASSQPAGSSDSVTLYAVVTAAPRTGESGCLGSGAPGATGERGGERDGPRSSSTSPAGGLERGHVSSVGPVRPDR